MTPSTPLQPSSKHPPAPCPVRSCCEELHAAKAQLQAQVKSMVRAETELTDNLKHTHQQIDDQLNLLREQLQVWGSVKHPAVRNAAKDMCVASLQQSWLQS